jgi:hypothetical protein
MRNILRNKSLHVQRSLTYDVSVDHRLYFAQLHANLHEIYMIFISVNNSDAEQPQRYF